MLLIKKGKITDPNSPYNGQKLDILIRDGRIIEVGKKIQVKDVPVLDLGDLHISIGWLDIGAQVGEPGFEHREDLATVTAAGAAGGYTGLACFPNTHPVVQSKSEVQFLKNHSGLVDFYPIGALSVACAGKDFAEIYDMYHSGAVAFSDGSNPIQSTGLMKRGLEYVKGINGLLINHPSDASMARGGQIHEGEVSTRLGMKGIPALAETLMLKRDLDLLEYTGSKLHIHNISTAGSVKLIKEIKQKHNNLSASVSIMNLIADHDALETFDVNYKVLPPLRTPGDRKALIKGLKNGIIEVINSNHTPLETESKKLEFPYADFGVIGLETTYALLNTHLGDQLSQEDFVRFLAINTRKILGLPIPSIREGEEANLTLFQPLKEWNFTKSDVYSKSKNTPFLNKSFRGKVAGIINGRRSNLKTVKK